MLFINKKYVTVISSFKNGDTIYELCFDNEIEPLVVESLEIVDCNSILILCHYLNDDSCHFYKSIDEFGDSLFLTYDKALQHTKPEGIGVGDILYYRDITRVYEIKVKRISKSGISGYIYYCHSENGDVSFLSLDINDKVFKNFEDAKE